MHSACIILIHACIMQNTVLICVQCTCNVEYSIDFAQYMYNVGYSIDLSTVYL